MFFEVLKRANSQGGIGYAESEDGKKWEYKKIIIDEPFHLSYPYMFKWEGSYCRIPESQEDLSIRLYRATSFPGEWQFVKSIINGEYCVDPLDSIRTCHAMVRIEGEAGGIAGLLFPARNRARPRDTHKKRSSSKRKKQ
jgi:hypothetical protein